MSIGTEEYIGYDNVILVGGSTLMEHCIRVIRKSYDRQITLLDIDADRGQRIIKLCEEYQVIHTKADKMRVMKTLLEQKSRTLVFSIMSPYIFTKEVVDNKNLTIINLHHALLPGHRGRNATAWAIYYQEKYAGISWCIVDEGVDTGGVLCKKEIEIVDNVTSIKLFQLQNTLAVSALEEHIEEWLAGRIEPMEYEQGQDYLHLSKDVPNNGELNLEWDIQKQSAFLSAMDYGIMKTLGDVFFRLEGNTYIVKSYKIRQSQEEGSYCRLVENALLINKEGYRIEIKCK
ncbi:formyltransferase family protein [Anaerosporobacter sp.]|uniref:formyltransferase family protein n=1 Tax=Anaerosporobacter sp. TaxID=1872529 RepID=UPI00286F8B23|nr:formyltransferase family protein [Anaerosporobacter sp.]